MLNPWTGLVLLVIVVGVYAVRLAAENGKQFFCTNCEYVGGADGARRPTGSFLLLGPFGFLLAKKQACPECKERGTLIPADSNRAKRRKPIEPR